MSLVDYSNSDTDNEDLSESHSIKINRNYDVFKKKTTKILAPPLVMEDVDELKKSKVAEKELFDLCRNLGPPKKPLLTRRNSSVTELSTSFVPKRVEVNNFTNVELDHDLEYSGGPFVSFSDLKPNKYTEKARNTSSVKAVKNYNVKPIIEPMEDYQLYVSDLESDSRTTFDSDEHEEIPCAIRKSKNHISYLAYEAKRNEEKLKNEWALNRMTRKQTQAKYGF